MSFDDVGRMDEDEARLLPLESIRMGSSAFPRDWTLLPFIVVFCERWVRCRAVLRLDSQIFHSVFWCSL